MDAHAHIQAPSLDAFIHTLHQLSNVTAQLTEAEDAKAQAASQKEHYKMDSFIKKEQALLLTLRGLEQRRCHQAENLGWKDLTFREILEKADSETQAALFPMFTQLQEQLQKLQDARDGANRIISVRLREFEYFLAHTKAKEKNASGRTSHFHDRYV